MAMTLTKPTNSKTGYKKTELGWIPEDWCLDKLGNLVKHQKGFAFSSKDYCTEGIRVIRISDTDAWTIHDKDIVCIPKEKTCGLGAHMLMANDVIITTVGSRPHMRSSMVGKVIRIPEKCSGNLLNQNMVKLIPISNIIDPNFLFISLSNPRFLDFISTIVRGNANQVSITLDDLFFFPIILPSLTEQYYISTILSRWDEAISKTTALIAAKAQLKRALTKQLFSAVVENSPKKMLSDIFARMTDKNAEGNTNVLTISGQDGLISQSKFFNKRVAAEEVSGYYLLKKGDFAYNKSYSNGYPMGAIKRLNLYESGIVSSLYICFRLKEDTSFNSDYFEHFFEYGGLNREIQMIAQEGARNHGLLNIGVQDFFNIQIPVPDYKTQTEIAFVLNLLEQEFQLLKLYLDKLKTQKQGLMQQLLTGKVRVKL